MYDRLDVGMGLIDFAVDEALHIERSSPRLDRVAVEIELQDVVGRDQARSHAARQQKAPRVGLVPHADMAEAIDHALVGENAVGGDEIVDEIGMRRHLCSRGCCFGRFQRRCGAGEQKCAQQGNRFAHASSRSDIGPLSSTCSLAARLTLADARDLIRGRRQSNGGGDGKTHTRPDRPRCFAPRVRMRCCRWADGARQPHRPGAGGRSRDRTRHQLFRYRGDVWERGIRA